MCFFIYLVIHIIFDYLFLFFLFVGSRHTTFNINEEPVLVLDWGEIAEAQSPELVVDCDKNHLAGEQFQYYTDTRNPIGYVDCEGTTDGNVQLHKGRPLMMGSIHYVTVLDPVNVLPPFGAEERSTVQYPHRQRTLLVGYTSI